MKGLILYGAKCTLDVWDAMKSSLTVHDVIFAEYPHEITEKAVTVSDITNYIYITYGQENFDFIIGHSMGGIIALELAANFKLACEKIIFIDSNLKPANTFYRNLLLPANMDQYGEKIISMIKSEASFYSPSLNSANQDTFDYTDYIKTISSKIYGIYGDRGQKYYANKISDLCLGDDIIAKINFRFVENSCHMPMVENANGLLKIILNILEE